MGFAPGPTPFIRLDIIQVVAEAAFAEDIPGVFFQLGIPTLPGAA